VDDDIQSVVDAALAKLSSSLAAMPEEVAKQGPAPDPDPVLTLGTHALVPLHPLEHAAGCVRQSSLCMRAFCCGMFVHAILSGLLTG